MPSFFYIGVLKLSHCYGMALQLNEFKQACMPSKLPLACSVMDFCYEPVDEKLNISQHRVLASQKTSLILGYIKRSTTSRSVSALIRPPSGELHSAIGSLA